MPVVQFQPVQALPKKALAFQLVESCRNGSTEPEKLMKPKLLVSAIGISTALIGAVVWLQEQPATQNGLFDYSNADVVKQGAELYADNCASCHGENLQGQDNWQTPSSNGRALAPPHDETGHTWHHPDEQLFQIVKFGTAALVGNGYESDMAGYIDVLSDAQIQATMAFIKSTWPEEIIERHNSMNDAATK